jgi:hypothetical protein
LASVTHRVRTEAEDQSFSHLSLGIFVGLASVAFVLALSMSARCAPVVFAESDLPGKNLLDMQTG